MTDKATLLELADRALARDADHIVADSASLDWLIAQLAYWPTRVDDSKTTNMRFLMMSAAATLKARVSSQEEDK